MAERKGASGRRAALGAPAGDGQQEPSIQGPSGRPQPAKRPSARVPAQQPVVDPDFEPVAQPEPEPAEDGGPFAEPAAADVAPAAFPSPRQPMPPVSGRMASPAASAARAGRRSGAVRMDGGPPIKKKVRGVGKELMVSFGVIGLMAVAALVVYIVVSRSNREKTRWQEEQAKILESNMKLGFDSYQRAENAGLLFVMGKDEKAADDKLFGPFRGDDKIYNVLYDRIYKDRRNKPMTEQKAMFADRRTGVGSIEKFKEENGVRVNYGFAENKTIPIVIARKMIKQTPGDNANLGGEITVIVKAATDHIFENAKKPKTGPEKTEKTENAQKTEKTEKAEKKE
jgi:hypothetical protein